MLEQDSDETSEVTTMIHLPLFLIELFNGFGMFPAGKPSSGRSEQNHYYAPT
jgi:hypothetical protein